MADIVVFSNEILNVLVLLGILGLIFTFLFKFYNILNSVKIYDIQMSIIFLSVGTIAYLFIEIGLFLNVTQDVSAVILEYNIYYWFARVLYLMLWIFWFVEIILYAAFSSTETLERMSKRKEERRQQRSMQFFRPY